VATGLFIAGLGACSTQGTVQAAPPAAQHWQQERLFNPTEADLRAEARGRVMIYDGMSDRDVNRAMREQFDRVHTMMFTRTIVTDERGKPRSDATSGEPVREDDGC
jgi:hypothetical protein